METILQDVRYGIRSLLKRPGFTAVALVTLALGIGANTAIFSVVNAVLLRPLPFKNPDRIMMVWERRTNSHSANLPVSGHEFVAWKERSQSFDALALVHPDGLNLTGRGDPVTVSAAQVSADFFSVIGVAPMFGRSFLPGEDQSDAQTAVLGQKLWNQRFGSDPKIVGQNVVLNNQTYNIVGVMPQLELMPDVLLPINLPDEARKVGKHSHQVMGRLKAGVTLAQAQTELAYISHQVEQERPNSNTGHGVQIVTLHEETVGNVRTALFVLLGAVAFVLLIACANVANLLLTRAAARQKEMAIRSALGAGRWRLVRQMLVESLLLATAGGALGLLAAVWLIEFIPKLRVLGIPRLEQVNIDYRVLASTVNFSLFAGLFAGIAPALRHSGPRLSQWMNEGTRGSGSRDRRRISKVLVVVEVALALVLLIGGGLMLKSFVKLVKVDPGFDPHQVLRLDLALPGTKYPEARQQVAFYEQLIERLKALPGAQSVGATTQTPLNPGDNWSPFVIEGRPELSRGQEQQAAMRSVTDDYFRTMKIPLRSGRFFSPADARRALPVMRWYDQQPYPEHYNEPQPIPTILINETMARIYWPNENPLGHRIKIIASPWLTIVGVVGDIHHTGLDAKPNPEMYLSDLQEPSNSLAIMMRTTGDPLQLAAAAREQVKALDKDQPLTVATMEQIFSESVAGQRFNTLLLGLFGALALILSMIGVFGVINYSVVQRTHEIGIRLALGAQRRDVFKMIISQGLVLALVGVAIGCAGALALTRLLTGLLFGVSPTDVETFVVVSLLLTVVALLACYIPARRATKVDPLEALRYE
jgi:putative ABC transport system permease protein